MKSLAVSLCSCLISANNMENNAVLAFERSVLAIYSFGMEQGTHRIPGNDHKRDLDIFSASTTYRGNLAHQDCRD